jgi:transposase
MSKDGKEEQFQIHLVMDNYGTHQMPKVRRWFARRPRYHLHFTPTSASWLNQVERFFGLLTDRRIRRGTFGSARELEAAIRDYLSHHNQNPKPFVWTADADSILKKIARFCMRTSDSRHQRGFASDRQACKVRFQGTVVITELCVADRLRS